VAAAREIGLPLNRDFNGAQQEGVGYFQVTQKHGQRFSAAAAYLKPAFKRPNLSVRTHVQAMRLLCEQTHVTGVACMFEGKEERFTASREVILSAGSINSPQVLMLSGIGPADHLRALGIPVVQDLPGVGQNLQDHLSSPVLYASKQAVSLASAESVNNVLSYLLFKKGPLTSNVAEAAAFYRTRDDFPAPDLELIFAPVYYMEHGFTVPKGHGFTLVSILLRPQSRGSLKLRSRDPFEPPLIRPNYLDCPDDLQVLIEGIRLAHRVAAANAFVPFRGEEQYPGVQSDEEAIRNAAETLYHPVGTCKMGNDQEAVVDSQLRVYGMQGLRVVDASIMPTIISGHTNAPTIMIAEKAADLIRGLPPLPAEAVAGKASQPVG